MYRIISFDGGGLKGLISLGMLERISAELGDDSWIKKADLYAGTSTGGLIALALAANKELTQIKEFYENCGPRIFNRRTLYYASSICRLLHVGYRDRSLENGIKDMFGSLTLDQLDKKVLVVSFNLRKKISNGVWCWAPKVFHNFSGNDQDKNPLVKVGLYTSAAPTYLPSVDGYVDGGVCANNPSLCAVTEVLDPDTQPVHPLSEIQLISVGTGHDRISIGKKDVKWGIVAWNIKILDMVRDGAEGVTEYQCRQLLTPRYLRVQKELNKKIEMDDASCLEKVFDEGYNNLNEEDLGHWVSWIKENWLANPPV